MFQEEAALLARPDYLGVDAGDRILKRFSQPDRNIRLAERLAEACQNMAFWELIELVGFSAYPID